MRAASYDVALDAAQAIGTAATATLRATMQAKCGKPGLFDFGSSINALRAACEAETGLNSPSPSRFVAA